MKDAQPLAQAPREHSWPFESFLTTPRQQFRNTPELPRSPQLPSRSTPGKLSTPLQQPRSALDVTGSGQQSRSAPKDAPVFSAPRLRMEDVELDKNAKLLGKGTFGIVYKARLLRSEDRKAAVKVIEKAKLQQMKVSPEIVKMEVKMMRECSGADCKMKDRFVQLFDFIESNNKYYIIMEFCENGNLQDAAMSSNGGFGEQHVRMLMKQMLEAVVFLHSKEICHRDVKPDNYLVCGNINSQSVKIKLGDFGMAVRIPKGRLRTDSVGTPAFMAPEMHLLNVFKSSGYDHKVDIWAIGVCMVFLLASEYPFIDGSGRLLRQNLIQGEVPLWDTSTFRGLFNGFQEAIGIRKQRPSPVAIDLTRLLLAPKRQDRPGANAAIRHDWFHKQIVETSKQDDNLPLLNSKDFQVAFSAIEREVQSAVEAISKVSIGTNDFTSQGTPAHVQGCAACRGVSGKFGYVCPHCHTRSISSPQAPTDTFSTAASMGDVAQPRFFQQDQMHQLRSRSLSDSYEGTNFLASLSSIPQGRRASVPDMVHERGCQMEAMLHTRRPESCFMCNKPSSMMDHVCPLCNSSVCAACIQMHLHQDLHCPCCHDRERNAGHMRTILTAHALYDSWQNLWGTSRPRTSTV